MATYVAEALNDPTLYFETLTWTGDGNTPRTLTGLNFQPNMVWSKRRDDAAGHNLLDSVRGAGANSELCPSSNGIEGSNAAETYGYLSAFTSDGFTVTQGSSDNAYWNNNTATYVAWCWKESATAGMDIVLYSGNGTAGNTFSHSLSAVPHLVFCKIRNAEVADWYTYNASLGNTKNIYLNTTGAVSTSNLWWNATTPTSSVVTLGDQTGNNGNARNFVAYCFAPKQGYSAMGSYTGNGDASDGAFIYLGFKPAFFICKNYQDSGDNWILHDNKRNTFNVTDEGLAPNDTGAEFTDVDMDFLSNGVKMRNNTGRANAAKTFIYIAFAESPFVNSNGVPNNAR